MSRSAPSELPALSLLDLPTTWLANLVQHVGSGPDGLTSAAALAETCKPFYTLSESTAVTYRNVYIHNTISSPDHPAWKWLAKRRGRVSTLVMKVHVRSDEELMYDQGEQQEEQPAAWEGPWQSLAAVQDLQLTLRMDSLGPAQPRACEWLKQHSHLLATVSADIMVDSKQLTLQSFSDALASCNSLDLAVSHPSLTSVDISSLLAVKSCLVNLGMLDDMLVNHSKMIGVTTFACLTKLTALTFDCYTLTSEEPWPALAALSSLKYLRLVVAAHGDPSPLSALTGLTSLYISSARSWDEGDDAPPLQLQQLAAPQHDAAAGRAGADKLCLHRNLPPGPGWAQQLAEC